ncbi:MAG: GntR family transcriptional regulator [Cyclobacteriaceae bacterium]
MSTSHHPKHDYMLPVYLQLATLFYEEVLTNQWRENERIPSVRDFAIAKEVNPNTAMRTFTYLQEQEIIFNKKGIGYFLSEKAKEKVTKAMRSQLFDKTLKDMMKKMDLLHIPWEEVTYRHNQLRLTE